MSSLPPAAPRPPRSTRQWLTRLAVGALLGAVLGTLLQKARGHATSAPPPPANAGEWIAHMKASGYPPAMLAAIALWVGFSLYWEYAARNSSQAASAETRGSRLVHLAIVSAGQLCVIVAVPGLRARLWPDADWAVALGLLLVVASVGLAVWARRCLGRHWSGEITTKVDHELITAGPYAFVRHPIYTGVLGMCVGTTLVAGELHALVGTALVVIAYARKIHLEEKNLTSSFGPAWESYRARTKALIPGVY
jgi:protein-S-isoprenylcysteine O-methyltransferase Ste14